LEAQNSSNYKQPEMEKPARIDDDIASKQPESREEFIWRLKQSFDELLSGKPHVVTLQEVVQYDENGDLNKRKDLINESFFSGKGISIIFLK